MSIDRTFSTAPMMEWSDRHCRYFWRKISRHAVLYTEMVTTGALIHADPDRFLPYHEEEHPIALQLGGSNPSELATCAKLAEQYGYDEINLNVGCPSDRVQNNMIGACLMAHPELVRDCLKEMKDSTDKDVTIKHRIGIDDNDSFQELVDFVGTVAESGVSTFIIHARKAILDGLSPKENREIPPLKYDYVHQIKQLFPQLEIIINGGFKNHSDIQQQLKFVDGVMVGREAYQNPWMLADVDQLYFNASPQTQGKEDIARSMYDYIDSHVKNGGKAHHVTRHMINLFQGQAGARKYRRYLSEFGPRFEQGHELLKSALEQLTTAPTHTVFA